jgi:hypothetical protein
MVQIHSPRPLLALRSVARVRARNSDRGFRTSGNTPNSNPVASIIRLESRVGISSPGQSSAAREFLLLFSATKQSGRAESCPAVTVCCEMRHGTQTAALGNLSMNLRLSCT